MLKAGIIGMGNIARNSHMNAYKRFAKENGPVTVEAVCDIRPEMMTEAKEKGLRTYTDVDEMLKAEQGKLDYVDICVPTFLHAEIAIKAMEAGFNVLSEKPMALTVELAEKMVEASKRTGKLLMSAYCNRFYDGACFIKQLIDSKELGEVRHAEFKREGGTSDSMGWNDWFHDASLSGGATLDLHIHDVDMIRWMFGMPAAVSTVAASYFTKGGYDAISANFMYDNNTFVYASCNWSVPNNHFNTRVIRVNFDKGYVYLERTPGRMVFNIVRDDGTVTEYPEKIPFDAYYNEIAYFVDCLAGHKTVDRCLPEETADSVKIVMAEIESADRGGARIEL